ncbi:hypothetical protein B0I08_103290 [Glaciihabitans tibetensis]|uniref:CAAX prenyl protease 2/Lysostaphin resistance protein A-like domain-containing protein n=1 Tax=Glaciihabitans tibetensis TaxID=1266600 RepID=A0A2T0VG99_9MICO|nr:CPBP family intramembrane glutamic endopeptidase [Glaciihabitans tibetensis]PRY69084.1 hypothetical protein B0I08_103290 [Glaciihabitans tibetensis]
MTASTTRVTAIPRVWWVGVTAAAAYVLLVAVVGNIVGDMAGDDEFLEFALSHFVPLPIAIALGLIFLHRARWGSRVWTETPTSRLIPRRRWPLMIPVLMVALPLAQVFDVPWTDRSVGLVLTVVLATALVGIGEELFFRGILLESIRAHHGELVTLLATSVLFGFAHVIGSVWAGVPAPAIAFQVTFLAMNGSLYYWVRRATGQLWVAMAVHALTDCILYLASGATRASETLAQQVDPADQPVLVVVQFLLIGAAVAGVVSAAREDHRTRRTARLAAS